MYAPSPDPERAGVRPAIGCLLGPMCLVYLIAPLVALVVVVLIALIAAALGGGGGK